MPPLSRAIAAARTATAIDFFGHRAGAKTPKKGWSKHSFDILWLVVEPYLSKKKEAIGMMTFPSQMEKSKSCSKPPTTPDFNGFDPFQEG